MLIAKSGNPQKLSFFNANKFLLLQLSYNLNRSNIIIFTPSNYRKIEFAIVMQKCNGNKK